MYMSMEMLKCKNKKKTALHSVHMHYVVFFYCLDKEIKSATMILHCNFKHLFYNNYRPIGGSRWFQKVILLGGEYVQCIRVFILSKGEMQKTGLCNNQ